MNTPQLPDFHMNTHIKDFIRTFCQNFFVEHKEHYHNALENSIVYHPYASQQEHGFGGLDNFYNTLKNMFHNIELHTYLVHNYLEAEKNWQAFVEVSIGLNQRFIFFFNGIFCDDKKEDFQIISINITETCIAKTLLHQTEEELAHVYDNIPGAILRCKIGEDFFRVEFASQGFYDLIGHSSEEFTELFHNCMYEFMIPEDKKGIQKQVTQALQNISPKTSSDTSKDDDFDNNLLFNFRTHNTNGELCWLEMHAKLHVHLSDVCLYIMCQDISQRYYMEQKLSLIQEKMHHALKHAQIHYWDYFPDKNKAVLPIFEKHLMGEEFYYNFPQSFIETNKIHPASANDFIALHEKIKNGASCAEADIRVVIKGDDTEEWRKLRYSKLVCDQEYCDRSPCFVGTSESLDAYKSMEQQFDMAMRQINVYVWVFDIKAKCITSHSGMSELKLGHQLVMNVPDCFIDMKLVHEDDIEKVLEMHKALEEGANEYRLEARFYNTQKQLYWARVTYTAVKDKFGNPYLAFGSSQDITEKKNSEKYYQEALNLWDSNISETLLSSIINLDKNNVQYLKLGEDFDLPFYTDGDKLLSHIATLIGDDSEQADFSKKFRTGYLKRAYTQGSNIQIFEAKIMLAQNKSTWVSIKATLLKQPETGDTICFLSISDICETKIPQDFTQTLIQSQFDFVLYVQYELDEYKIYYSEHIREAISRIMTLSGRYNEDVEKITRATGHEDDVEAILNAIETNLAIEQMREKGNYDLYFRIYRGEEIRHKQLRFTRLDEKGKSFYFGCVDVTEAHTKEVQRVENLRQALDIAKQANDAKSTFLASMSHDIRTPMNAIIGMTNLAIEDIDNKDQIQESLSVIKSSSEHLLSLLNDILEMSRLESGKVVFNKDSFNIEYECQQVFQFFRGLTTQKNQGFKFICENITHKNVISDMSRFNRVLTNLLGNAVKFTPDNGSITFSLEEIEELSEKIKRFRIIVKDSGIGIPEEGLATLFDAFYRDEKNVSHIEGTGLGLAIVKAIVDYQNGDIHVESELGKGTTFVLDLPMLIDETQTEESSVAKQNINSSAIDLQGKHILLVEDHPINVLVATKLFEKMNAKITVAVNGLEGVEKFTESEPNTFDFIIMDLQMPVMGGLDASKNIRKSLHPQAKNIPIIAMTANAFAEDVKNSKDAGMDFHIAKPITVENIQKCLLHLNLI